MLLWNKDRRKICSLVEREKSIFKIVTKTKNENFFIEKWIRHHIKILKNTKLIIFDNMSTDEYVIDIYKKYERNIILVKFDGFMDAIHMAHLFMPLYKALSRSSIFFTIIDSDEYLYLYDGNTIVSDCSVTAFLKDNQNAHFFAPCWMDNINADENLFSFDPRNLWLFHLGKPIVNSKIIPKFEIALSKYNCPILHHTKDLPLSVHGEAPTRFLLLHLKNLNRYQRIRANMEKLVAFKIVAHRADFKNLFQIDADLIQQGHVRAYVRETRKLAGDILDSDGQGDKNINNTFSGGRIEVLEDCSLRFFPDRLEEEFKKLIAPPADYFSLIDFSADLQKSGQATTINSYLRSVSG
ncbi:MAG: hypothetical protein LBQ10_08290 [Desulfovibrio sp.]|jgi:hypothetical protein|nr:hypothetical protein [Desulfovibrio sp.]